MHNSVLKSGTIVEESGRKLHDVKTDNGIAGFYCTDNLGVLERAITVTEAIWRTKS